jgi:hypothetical protein
MSTRGPRGRFLALEPAQAGFKQLEIAVTNVFVAMFSGSLRPNVRMNRVMRPKMGAHRSRQHAARYPCASLLAREQAEAAPRRHARQNPMSQRVARALAPARTATEANRGYSRQDAVPWHHAGLFALERTASEAGHCRPRKGVVP